MAARLQYRYAHEALKSQDFAVLLEQMRATMSLSSIKFGNPLEIRGNSFESLAPDSLSRVQ